MVGLCVARGSQRILRREALALVDGVVELAVGVAHLAPVDKELKALDLAGVAGLFLGEGADLDGVIHDEHRLDQILLAEGLEEEIDNVAALMPLLISHIVLTCNALGLLLGEDLVEVDAGVALDGVDHGQPLKGLAEVDLGALVADGRLAADDLRQPAEHLLGKIHHPMVVGIGLIELHQRELGVMAGIQSLIAEDAADLEDLLQAADDQALEVELKGNAQTHVHVQRIVVRLKGARGGAARIGDEHGRLDLDKALLVEKAADLADHERALDKGIARFGIHDQIDIALAVAQLAVGHAVELLRQRLERLAEQGHALRVDRGLAGLGLENIAGNAEDIADIHLLEVGIRLFADGIPRDIDLDQPLAILQLAEGGLTHDALDHHAPGNGDTLLQQGFRVPQHICAVMRHVKARDREGILAGILQRGELVPPDPQDLAELLLRLRLGSVMICHMLSPSQFSTERISKRKLPAGASTLTESPARWPISARPTGESSEILPSRGLAS